MGAQGRVISFFSTKGGVGKTIIATNLAATFTSYLHRSAALLGLDPSAADPERMVGSSGVRIISEPVTNESLPALLSKLRQAFAFVLVDAGSLFSEVAVTAFEHSDLVLVVAMPDAVSLRHATRTVEMLETLKFPLRMVKAVINRAESRGHVRSSDVRARLPVEVIAEIPSDGRLVGLSLSQGRPLVLFSERGGKMIEAFIRFGTLLVEHPELFVERVIIDRSALPGIVQRTVAVNAAPSDDAEPLMTQQAADPIAVLKRKVHSRLIERFDLKRMDLALNDPFKARQLKERTAKVALDLIGEEGGLVVGRINREQLIKEIVDEALGLGPLEDLLADEDVSDILVNGKDAIYVERHGKLSLTDKTFLSNDQVLTVIERIIAPLGRRIDESNPMVDARLPDGSRVNAIIPPLAINGPTLSIRKFGRVRFTMEDLIRLGTLDARMAEFLHVCVMARKDLIVSGGTGSGKTTVLNVLSSYIPTGERIITIEDAAELQLSQEHWVPLEARPPNIEGKGMISIRHVFRNALRMRPDRIIIGECRGDETLDMLQAMNTGHDGSMTTLHANSPQDVIARLDSLVLMSNIDLPVRAVREQIASAIDLIVHTARLSDGSRKITHITEMTGMDERTDITFKDLFVFRQQGLGPNGEVLGAFEATGQRPSFLEEMRAKGFSLDEALFRHADHR